MRRMALTLVTLGLLSGCTTRVGDLTILSTKNVALQPTTTARNVEGRDCTHMLLFLPLGKLNPTLDEALENAMRDGTAADLAFMNRGGVRDILPAGELLARNVWNVAPFGNTVVTTEISGRKLIEMHETVLRRNPLDGYESLDPDRIYRLATNNFSAGQWRDRGIDLEWTETGVLLRDMIIAWVRARDSLP